MTDMVARKTVHVTISGRVQGVFFRDWTRQNAQELGLDGWVRNLRDGRVEAVFSGEDRQVNIMLQLCRKGPGSAFVQKVKINILPKPFEDTGFSVRTTA